MMCRLLAALSLSALLAGCASDAVRTSWSQDVSSDAGRTITHHEDGVRRSIVVDGEAQIVDGVVMSLPAGVTVMLDEEREGVRRLGRVRNADGVIVHEVEVGGVYVTADTAQRAWIDDLLELTIVESDESEQLLADAEGGLVSAAKIAEDIDALSFDSDQRDVLSALVARPALSSKEQAAIVEAADELTFASSQSEVLMALLARDDLARDVWFEIVEFVDDVSFDSDAVGLLIAAGASPVYDFTLEMRSALHEQLDELSFDSSRNKVREAWLHEWERRIEDIIHWGEGPTDR